MASRFRKLIEKAVGVSEKGLERLVDWGVLQPELQRKQVYSDEQFNDICAGELSFKEKANYGTQEVKIGRLEKSYDIKLQELESAVSKRVAERTAEKVRALGKYFAMLQADGADAQLIDLQASEAKAMLDLSVSEMKKQELMSTLVSRTFEKAAPEINRRVEKLRNYFAAMVADPKVDSAVLNAQLAEANEGLNSVVSQILKRNFSDVRDETFGLNFEKEFGATLGYDEKGDARDFTAAGKLAKLAKEKLPKLAPYVMPALRAAEAAIALGVVAGLGGLAASVMHPSAAMGADACDIACKGKLVDSYFANGGTPFGEGHFYAKDAAKNIPQNIFTFGVPQGAVPLLGKLTDGKVSAATKVAVYDANDNEAVDAGRDSVVILNGKDAVYRGLVDPAILKLLYPSQFGIQVAEDEPAVIAAAAPVENQNAANPQPKYDAAMAGRVAEILLAPGNDAQLFHSAIDIRKGKSDAFPVDACNFPPEGHITLENLRKARNVQFADFFNAIGAYKHADSELLGPVQNSVGGYVLLHKARQAKAAGYDPAKQKIQRTGDATSTIADIVYPVQIRGITNNMGSPGKELHEIWSVRDRSHPNGYCMAVPAGLLALADENLLRQKVNENSVVAEGTQPQENPPENVAPEQNATPEAALPQPPKKPEMIAVVDNGINQKTGKEGKLRLWTGVDSILLSEKVKTEVLDENGVPLVEEKNRSMNYFGGHLGIGVKPIKAFDWLELVGEIYALGGSGNSQNSSSFRYLVGPSVKIGNALRLNVFYAGSNGNLSLKEDPVSVKQDWNFGGADFSIVTENLLSKFPGKALWLWAGFNQQSGKLKMDATVDMSSAGIPDVKKSTSQEYKMSTVYGGLEAPLIPLGKDGKIMLGPIFNVKYTKIDQGSNEEGENQGLTMTAFEPGVGLWCGLGKNRNHALLFKAGYGFADVKSEDPSIKQDKVGYGFLNFQYNFGAVRPTPNGFTYLR